MGGNTLSTLVNRKGEIVHKAIFAVLVLAALAAQFGNIVWGT